MWCVCRADGWVGGWIAEMEDGVGCGGVWWRVEELGSWGVGRSVESVASGMWRVIGGRGWGAGQLGSLWCGV